MTKLKRIMTKKFERVIPYSTIEELWHTYDDFEDFACAIERAVLTKRAEQQEPAAWLHEETGDVISSELKDYAPEMLKGYDVPLYKHAYFSCQGLLDSSNHIASTGEGNVFSARDLCLETGYAKWDSFKNLVLRASQMISNGIAKGSIKETKKSVDIGSGAKRRILDYKLDDQAKELVCFLAGSFKLNRYYALRNETAILSLVKKWCDLRGIATHHQKEVGGFFVDLQVGESISIEFDEPHHAEQKKEDEIKTKALQAHGNRVLRFGIDCDVIDIITELEKLTLASKMVTPDGWQFVPVEPTAEMCDAADFEGEFSFSAFEQAEDFWSAMLAAAPKYKWR